MYNNIFMIFHLVINILETILSLKRFKRRREVKIKNQ